ncbi:MAG: tetratricopeptide repeat protein [Rhodothermales bacterium]|nr:tetratricopeptide repeat protein [Rhodothermales bacterium]
MKTHKLTSIITGLALTGVVVVAGWLAYSWLKPEEAPDVAQVPATPASLFLNAESSAAFYEDRIRKAPDDLEAYTRLAQVYLQLSRQTGDETRFVPLASERIEQALARNPDDYYAQVLHASLLNILHRFDEARGEAEALAKVYPHDSAVQGILVDAFVELGDYEAAVTASDQLLAMRPGLAAYARASYLRELHGDAAGAIEAMELAVEAGVPGQEDRTWALMHLGTLYLGQGDLESAERIYNGILEEAPGYAQALAGLGHIAHIEGATESAIAYLGQAYAQEPRGAFLEVLVEVFAASGDEATANLYLDRVEAGYRAASAMGENNRMEYADFLADRGERLEEALELAEAEVRRRPGHLHANETHAWVLHKLGRSAEAVAPIERAMRLNTGDAMVHFRAGHIYRAIGDTILSERHFRAALEANLYIESLTAAEEARGLIEE